MNEYEYDQKGDYVFKKCKICGEKTPHRCWDCDEPVCETHVVPVGDTEVYSCPDCAKW